jgi:hypothetical protein
MRFVCLALLALFGLTVCGTAAERKEKANWSVLYIGDTSTPRGKAYTAFLREHFRRAESAERKGFDPRKATEFDVVLLDWSQRDRPQGDRTRKPASPLGPKETWNKPTVLLGSAGLLLAEAWEIHGAIG